MIAIWDVGSRRKLQTLKSHGNWCEGISFSQSGELLAAGAENVVELWDVRSFQRVGELRGHSGAVTGVLFTGNDRRIITAGNDATIKVWDVPGCRECLTLRSHAGRINQLAISPEGDKVASVSADGSTRIWDAKQISGAEREAYGRVQILYALPLSRRHVLEWVRDSEFIWSAARNKALEIVDRYREETRPEVYEQAARERVLQAYLNPTQYRIALLQSETAHRLAPDDPRYALTLGMAQYRAGNFKEAMETIMPLARNSEASIELTAFLAMTHHRLGQKENAKAALDRLRLAAQGPKVSKDIQVIDLLKEAEEVIEPKDP
jgi:hypothetical protein